MLPVRRIVHGEGMKTAKRKRLGKYQFALRKQRKYPIDTRKRASNAKSRSTQQYKAGKLSKSDMEKVHRRANKVLAETK